MKFRILFLVLILTACFTQLGAAGLRETIKDNVDAINVSNEVKVFLLAMLPIFELRGSIPLGIHYYQLPYWKVIPLSLAGNMVPIFFILLFFDFVTKICFRFKFLKKILEAVFRRTRSKSEIIEKYEEVGLMIFVAIPLPITGAWTGSLAAYLMGLSFGKSILFIFLGVLIAGIVVSFLTSLKWVGALIASLALLYLLVKSITRRKVKNEIPEN
ncbi:MAG: small multi-drug export protein [Candidatus Cloacimonetes bacterium]|nr:small multi-drug export protein [Candidatus Cloacimonadota bacterium]